MDNSWIIICSEKLLHGYRLGEVAGLVHIAALHNGNVVCQKLQRNNRQQRREALLGGGDSNRKVRHIAYQNIALGNHTDDPPLARFDFLNIRNHLFVCATTWRNHHHRHLLRDKGNGSVFHLGCGIALGVYITDFLEFECALQCNRIVVTTPEVDKILRIGECLGKLGNGFVLVKNHLDFVRNQCQFAND